MKYISLPLHLTKLTLTILKQQSPSLRYHNYIFALWLFVAFSFCFTSVKGQVSGTVFRDIDGNGLQSTTYLNEPGVSGLTVRATKPDGTTLATTTSATGSFTFTVAAIPAATKVRIDFLASSTEFDSPLSASSGTSVQFITAPSTTANLGLITTTGPNKFFNPCVVSSCFIAVNTPNDPALIAFQAAEVKDDAQPFTNGGTTQFNRKPQMNEVVLATQGQVGTINGLTYHTATNTILAAAFVRNSGRMPQGSGAIYKVVNPNGTPTISLLTTISNTGSLSAAASVGTEALTGYAGLGDLALSTAQDKLYTVNLNTRELVEIPLSGTALTAGTPTTKALPVPTVSGTTAADFHPLGLGYKNGKLYIAITCGKLGSQAGYIYEYDGTTFTLKLTIPFDYTRAFRNANYYGYSGYPQYLDNNNGYIDWNATLASNYLTNGSGTGSALNNGTAANPKFQPWVADIEFDGNDMIIGVRSRLADARNNSFWVVGGDILRACSTDGVTWSLENNGTCGTKTTGPIPSTDPYTGRAYTGTFNTYSLNTNFGPGGAEYYWGDDGFEGEASQGSLLMIPGYNDVLVSQVDAIGHTGQVGVMAMSNTTGAITSAGNIFFGEYQAGNNISKSNGLGALTFFPNPATIEIGNRIWRDDNRNGIQDPSEAGISGVTIGLFQSTTQIATAITSTTGEYYFSSADGTNTNNAKYNLALVAGTTYQLRILTTQTAVSSLTLTQLNVGSDNLIDSDFSPNSTTAVVSFVAGSNGQNDHSFDAGFYSCPTIAFTAPTAATVTQCANTTINLSVTSNAVAPDQIQFVYFDSPQTDPYTGGTVLGTVASTSVAGNKTVTLTGVQLPDNISTASSTIYVYAILGSSDGLCNPSAQRVIILNPRPTPGISGNPILCQGTTATLTASGPTGTAFQWFLNNGATSVSSLNPYTTPAISTTTTYRVRGTLNGCVSNEASIVLNPVQCTPCTSSSTSVGGIAYRDYNSNGTKEANDPGLSNITVTIFRCDANGTSTQVAQMQTDINGSYSFTGLTAGTDYRVEFTGFSAGYKPTYRGTNNGSTIQFTKPGSCSISVGLNQPIDYCQSNPRLVTPCYIDGAAVANSGLTDVLVSFDYNVATPNKVADASRVDIGSTWGLAYARTTKLLYVSAFLKRHVGLKDGKLGQIYVKDYNNPSAAPTPWLDVSTLPGVTGTWTYLSDAARGLGNAGSPSLDADAFAKIATLGLGDIDISDDNKTLYAMDLQNRQLLAIDIATKGLVGKYPVPDVCKGSAGSVYFTAASSSFTASTGEVWKKGMVFNTDNVATPYSQVINNPNSASAGTTNAALYTTSAYTSTSMSYGFPMGNGTYNVKLHLITNGATTATNVDILAEGTTVLAGFNTYAAAGNQINVGVTRSFTTTVTDGVLNINFLNKAGSAYALVSGFEITPTSGQPTGITRPFATKFYNNKVYVGAVCDASFSQNRDDLQATVFEFDPATGSYNPTPKLTFPLNYLRGSSFGSATNGSNNQWEPWTSIYPNNTAYGIYYGGFDVYTQPVLSDLEFDVDGSMILGFFDRFPNQIGSAPNYRPDRPISAGLTSNYGVVGGDVLRAYFNGSSFELENNGKEGVSSYKPATAGANGNEGPGGGEFYYGDAVPNVHNETSMGGLAILPGSGELRLTSGDPIVVSSGGVLALDNTTGAKIVANSITLYSGGGGGVQYKSNGLGDLELLCNIAPIQIGNRVWRDDNRNGIQDPCEPVIPGAVVTLYDATKTTAIASVTTNAAGEYYFSSTTVTAGTSTSSVATTALTYNSNYALIITSLGSSTVVTSQGLSLTDVSPLTPSESGTANSGQTTINNDAMVMNGKPTIMLTTGGPGAINHTYDFGIVKFICSLTVTAQASSQTVCAGQPITLTAQTSPASSYTYVWSAPVGVTLTGANTATATATASVAGLQTFTVTVSSSPSCFTSTVVSVSAVDCSTYINIAITDPGTCLSATNGYTTTGTLSLTNAIAGTATITDGVVSSTVSVSAGATSLSYSLSGLTSGTGSHTVTVSYAGKTASTTYTAPASCTVAPCGLALTVTPGLCESATNTYVLSGSITATNLPTSGTITVTSGAFATRTIPVPAGNASGPISYSGLIANGQLYTVTASYSSSACAPVSQTFTAPVSCSVAPVCSISALASAGQCATATNTYSATVVVTLANAPAGTISVSLPGATPVSQTLAANTGQFTAVFQNLPSDGISHTATISLPSCGTTSATFTAPASCSIAPVCSISVVATPGICQTATNTFTTVALITVTNPTTGILTVTDGPASLTFATTAGSPASFTASFAGIPSSGASHTVTASLPGCSTTSTTYTAPASCSVAPVCSITATATAGLCATATNTYSATAVVRLTNPTAGTLIITDGPQSATFAVTAGSSATFTVAFTDLVSDGSTHTITASLPGCSTTSATYTAPASCSVAPVCSVSAVVSAGSCASATNTYSATAVVTIKNPAAGGTLTVSTGGQTLTFSTTALSQNTFTATFNGLVSDGASHAVTVSLPGCGSTTAAYTAPASCSVAPVCSISAVATPGLCASATNTFSTTVLVTITNPTAGTLTVTDGARSVTFVVAASQGTTTAPAIFNGIPSDGAVHTVLVSLPGCSTTSTTYTAPASCSVSPLASLGDFVWYDTNGNGQQDAGETGVPGITVKLFNPASSTITPITSLTTDSNGKYLFTNLNPGVYCVQFDKTSLPVGYTLTSANAGTDATDSDADLTTGKTTNYTLAAGEQNLTVDAGIVPPTTSLSLDKLVDKSKAKLGDVLTYTLVLTNTGTTNAVNVTVRDSSTTGLRYVTGSATAPLGTTFTQGTPISNWKVAALSAGQSLSMTFQAIADSSGILYNKASIPGDTATVCTSVPYVMCAGDSYAFILTAPTGRTSYKWFKDNVEIAGQTTNVLEVTAPGTYSLAVNNVSGKCPDFSCCPFIVEEDTLPTFKATATPVTCVANTPQANGQIVLSEFKATYTYQYSLGTSFNGSASLSGSAKVIPAGGVLVSNLANPGVAQSYTIRVYNASGCYTDVTVLLMPTICGCPADVCVPYVISQTKRAKRIGDPR